jgi:hypothetical protein
MVKATPWYGVRPAKIVFIKHHHQINGSPACEFRDLMSETAPQAPIRTCKPFADCYADFMEGASIASGGVLLNHSD